MIFLLFKILCFTYSFSMFFISNINKLNHKSIQNICLLSYVDGLITLLKTKSNDLMQRNFILYPNCEVINDKVLDNFLEYSITGR